MKKQRMNFKISWACALKSEKMNVQDEETWFNAHNIVYYKEPCKYMNGFMKKLWRICKK